MPLPVHPFDFIYLAGTIDRQRDELRRYRLDLEDATQRALADVLLLLVASEDDLVGVAARLREAAERLRQHEEPKEQPA